MLGESVTSADDAAAAARPVRRRRSTRWPRADLDRNVSLKLTQMGLAIDRGLARRRTSSGSSRTRPSLDGFVRIDMEDRSTTDATLASIGAICGGAPAMSAS